MKTNRNWIAAACASAALLMSGAALSVSVSVNQANAANVTPNTYTDTIAITLTP